MFEAIKYGLILGLTLAVLIGPVFFALLQTSIQRGFFSAAMLALGIALSDSFYIFITNYFILRIRDNEEIAFFLGIFGGLLLIIIGIQTSLKKIQDKKSDFQASSYQQAGFLFRGFILNFAHPGVLIFWVGVGSLLATQLTFDVNEKIVLYSTTIITVFATDLLKAYTANKIRKFLTPVFLLWMNRVMGIVLIIFGIHLFVTTLIE